MNNCWKFVGLGVGVVGLLLLIGGFVLVGISNNIVESMVKKETQLKNGTDIYDKWVDLPVPIYLKFYMWNVTNWKDFQGMDDWSAIPELQEVGPFVYKEKRVKYAIQSDTNTDTVKYRQNITYTFVPELSGGLDDTKDLVNVVNVPLFSIAAVLTQKMEDEQQPFPADLVKLILRLLTSSAASRERLVKLNVAPRDVIFGWRLNLIYDMITGIGGSLGLHFPPELQHGQFGFYLDRNGQNADGLWEVYSGIKDSSRFATVKTINGLDRREDWWEDHCAMITGTDGTMFPPLIKKDTTLYAYAPEICRSVWLTYKEETEYEGIKGYRFGIPTELFTSPLIQPDNQCYCLPVLPPLNASCDFNGGGRIWSCKEGAPIIISKPHFLDADENALHDVKGLSPDAEKHDTIIDVEPYTGFPLKVNKRLQIGIEAQPLVPTGDILGAPWNTIRHTMFPTIWADESAALDDALVDEIKDKLVKPMNLLKAAKWSLVGVGAFLLVLGGGYFSYAQFIKK